MLRKNLPLSLHQCVPAHSDEIDAAELVPRSVEVEVLERRLACGGLNQVMAANREEERRAATRTKIIARVAKWIVANVAVFRNQSAISLIAVV
jgi:hypothetical protein